MVFGKNIMHVKAAYFNLNLLIVVVDLYFSKLVFLHAQEILTKYNKLILLSLLGKGSLLPVSSILREFCRTDFLKALFNPVPLRVQSI